MVFGGLCTTKKEMLSNLTNNFYPKNVKFRGRNVFSIHYSKLYDDYEIYTEAELNTEKEEMDEDYFYHFKDLSFSEISMLYLACTRCK